MKGIKHLLEFDMWFSLTVSDVYLPDYGVKPHDGSLPPITCYIGVILFNRCTVYRAALKGSSPVA